MFYLFQNPSEYNADNLGFLLYFNKEVDVISLTYYLQDAYISKDVYKGLLTLNQRVQAMLIDYWSKADMLVDRVLDGRGSENVLNTLIEGQYTFIIQ